MKTKTFEFKAKVSDIAYYEKKLLNLNPTFIGNEEQTDTYFKVNKGRLKLRESLKETTLINYFRENTVDTKKSEILVCKLNNQKDLKEILILQFGVKIIVNKKRKIYELENVRFHLDKVEGLGNFMEVEVTNSSKSFNSEKLKYLCDQYFDYFQFTIDDSIPYSYSDLLEEIN